MEYRNVGTHPVDLDDGRSIGYGEFAELDKKQAAEPVAAELIEAGIIIPVKEEKASTTAKKEEVTE